MKVFLCGFVRDERLLR